MLAPPPGFISEPPLGCTQDDDLILPGQLTFILRGNLGLDDDGDTDTDEDPIDGIDNDMDTSIDEDPPNGETKSIVERIKLVCHSMSPQVYNLTVEKCIDSEAVNDPGVEHDLTNNCDTIQKPVVIE